MTSDEVREKLDKFIPNPRCELVYSKDYELLIATLLSAQSTDKRVNEVTKILFSKYDIFSLSKASLKDIENIIYPVGTYKRKAIYIKELCKSLIKDYNGIVPNNREYLESLPGVGRKTTNVVLSLLYNVPTMPVDTHVARVSKRLNIVNENDDVSIIEDKLMNFFPQASWNRIHHQLVLFGRYTCKSKNPECAKCPFRQKCIYNERKMNNE